MGKLEDRVWLLSELLEHLKTNHVGNVRMKNQVKVSTEMVAMPVTLQTGEMFSVTKGDILWCLNVLLLHNELYSLLKKWLVRNRISELKRFGHILDIVLTKQYSFKSKLKNNVSHVKIFQVHLYIAKYNLWNVQRNCVRIHGSGVS